MLFCVAKLIILNKYTVNVGQNSKVNKAFYQFILSKTTVSFGLTTKDYNIYQLSLVIQISILDVFILFEFLAV